MELMDVHTLIMPTVLIVHFLGVLTVATSAALLAISLFVVVLAVHAIRSLWALHRKHA